MVKPIGVRMDSSKLAFLVITFPRIDQLSLGPAWENAATSGKTWQDGRTGKRDSEREGMQERQGKQRKAVCPNFCWKKMKRPLLSSWPRIGLLSSI